MIDLGLTGALRTPSDASSAFADVTAQSFERDVLVASQTKPVIVQFWAPWCGPCKQLKPLMEKAVTAAGNTVTMVRVNIDTSPELAQALRVQSVPMVYAFFRGQPVDGFVGMRPESEIVTFVSRLVKMSGAEATDSDAALAAEALKKTLAEADAFFAAGQITEALAAYSTAFDLDPSAGPDSAPALAGIAWCFVAGQDTEAFDAIVSDLSPEQRSAPTLSGVLHLAAWRAEWQALSAPTPANDKDMAARLDQARAQLAALDVETALTTLLAMIRADRAWNEEAARLLLLEILDALGNAHPLVKPTRRTLSSILFS